tara:strand:- start:99 stop:590 length:492 start_codon:yes stop_codon:yes gene_type:complete
MRAAYADPPYLGQAQKHYQSDEVDHEALITELETYDAWALSCSTPSLHILVPMVPREVRVMAWVKPFCIFKPNVNPAYAWEPVFVKAGRKRTRAQSTVRDWVSANITLKTGLVGAKPPEFARWLFDVLNLEPSDEFYDLFPGTGRVTEAWERFQETPRQAILV